MSTQTNHVALRPASASLSDRALRADAPDTRRTRVITPVASERFDEYVLIAKIGEGGMAQIFLALSQGPGGFRKLMVVKRLHARLCGEPERIERFSLEANLAASLHHPNIVQTNRVGVFGDQPFSTMEYLDGQPLGRALYRLRSKNRRLPPALAVQIISQALDGLHYAHHATDYAGTPLGVVHRDISPHNLFLTYSGEIKLLDFGIAQAEGSAFEATDGVHGKSGYMAPEQARNEAVDARTDVWGMGVTLWECLVGRRLFQGDSDRSVLRASLTDEIPSASEVAPHVPEPLARVLERALQRNPERRFESALEFKEALDRWLGAERREDVRAALSSGMKALFADRIEERGQTLRTCMARLDALPEPHAAEPPVSGGSQPPAAQASVRPRVAATPVATSSMRVPATHPLAEHPAPVPSSSTSVAPAVAPRRRWDLKTSAWVVAALTAAVLALFAADFAQFTASDGPATAHATEAAAPQPDVAPPSALTASLAPPAPPAPREAVLPVHVTAPVSNALAARHDAAPPAAPAREEGKQASDGVEAHAASRAHRQEERVASEEAPRPDARRAQDDAPPERAEAAPVVEKVALGRLQLDSTPYAVVSLDGKRLGITPIDVELPAATHTLTLRNPEQDLETSYRVTVVAGEIVERRIALE